MGIKEYNYGYKCEHNLPRPAMYHINKDADTCQYTSVKSVSESR